VPKAAGTSIKKALSPYCDVVREDFLSAEEAEKYNIEKQYINTLFYHLPASELKKIIGPVVWDEYFKFAFVRNPYNN
jgi:hypothetical protein